MAAGTISLDQAKEEKLFYAVANVVVLRRSDNRCLILKRSEREKVHPKKYCVPGGKLEWKDLPLESPTRKNGEVLDYEQAIENLLYRETLEEAGIEIDTQRLHYLDSVAFIRPDGIPVLLIKFAAYYKSGEVILQKSDFTDYAWVNKKEVNRYDCILGIKEEVIETIQRLKK